MLSRWTVQSAVIDENPGTRLRLDDDVGVSQGLCDLFLFADHIGVCFHQVIEPLVRYADRFPGIVSPELRQNQSSSVLVSPSGKPSSRAFNNRRMILPERVFGSDAMNSISRGATPAPSFLRQNCSSSRRSFSVGS